MGADITNTYTILLIALTTWGGKSKFLCKKKLSQIQRKGTQQHSSKHSG